MGKKYYSLAHVIVIIIVTAVVSGLTVGAIITKNFVSDKGVNYTSLALDDNVRNFLDVYATIINDYYEDIDTKEAMDSAISGLLSYLDESYTTHLSKEDSSSLIEQLNASYMGIGITLKENTIISVIADSPAAKVGILPGDKLLKVNDNDVSKKSGSEISQIIKENGNKVKLIINRDNKEMSFELSITKLSVPTVTYEKLENTNIGYIRMTIFGNNLTKDTENALTKLKSENIESLVIDLRGNTGGYLDQAKNVASLFLKKGDLIYSLEDKNEKKDYFDEDNVNEEMKIVVLVNGSTASAAEILTAALKDKYGATIVGTTTFGKGKVQHTYSLDDGSLVKYTTSKWLRPDGTCIDKKGIKPDYEVELEYVYDKDDEKVIIDIKDTQLDKAIELLSK